ncbi:MAG: MBL fold metallo-hydrolase [Candidatus Wildermuthbacteria bacterium]|nr:MBL fold metallo-hydrolase [Candidatus Wildermuthbacteria bacterium]
MKFSSPALRQAQGGVLAFLLFLNFVAWKEVLKAGEYTVSFFDVGQGDAILIETPLGRQILIDGGPDKTILEKLGSKLPFWDKTIDLVLLSHPASDHVTGLIGVLEKYKVHTIVWNGIEKDTQVFKQWKEGVQREGARVVIADAPQNIADIEILYPFESLQGKKFADDNDTSIIAKFHTILFMGDATFKTEKALLDAGADIDSGVLKIGHHGSKTSSSRAFIEAVSPEIAVIQAGKDNQYGHPHQQTLETLAKYGIEIRRTDLEGDIIFHIR